MMLIDIDPGPTTWNGSRGQHPTMSENQFSSRAPRAFSGNSNDSSAGDIAFVKLLRDLPIFNGLSIDELDVVSALFRKHLYQSNDVIFERSDPGTEAYVILRGTVRIVLENGKPIGTFEKGSIFGELAFLDGEARGAKAIAQGPTILLILKREDFEGLAESRSKIGKIVYKNIARELTGRLRRMNAAMESTNDSWGTAMFRRSDQTED